MCTGSVPRGRQLRGDGGDLAFATWEATKSTRSDFGWRHRAPHVRFSTAYVLPTPPGVATPPVQHRRWPSRVWLTRGASGGVSSPPQPTPPPPFSQHLRSATSSAFASVLFPFQDEPLMRESRSRQSAHALSEHVLRNSCSDGSRPGFGVSGERFQALSFSSWRPLLFICFLLKLRSTTTVNIARAPRLSALHLI